MSAKTPSDLTGLHPTARPDEKRGDIDFTDKDAALRHDVHDLGTMIGHLLREQGGEALFEAVETARRLAIGRREGEPMAGSELDRLVRSLSIQTARDFVRGFSTYFQVVNTAEQVHRIRRKRDYLKDSSVSQPGGIEETVLKLRDAGTDLDELLKLIQSLHIEPVFTAHATNPTRRTVLRKQLNIIRRMVEMQNPAMTPQEISACFEGIRADVTAIWQTDEQPEEAMTVFDELEHVLFFLSDVIYRALPSFYETLEASIQTAYDLGKTELELPPIIHFASWIGGDIGGNREVTARMIRETLARHQSLILDLYHRECMELSGKLSQGTGRVGVSELVQQRIDEYSAHFQGALGSVPLRHRKMPYRVFLRLIMERLQSTYGDDLYPYESAEEFLSDIQLIADSLRQNNGRNAGLFSVRRLIRRVETFGFHFMTLDIRQNALTNRDVVGHCLGEDNWLEQTPEYRAERIRDAIKRNNSPAGNLNNQAKRALAVFQAIAFCRRKYGERAIGAYIVSMARGVDDVLSVILLAQWGDLRRSNGAVPLDIVPLFERVEDLTHCHITTSELVNDELYRGHLNRRGNRQTIMVGYSDSNKDGGLVAARWVLQEAQSALVKTVTEAGVELTMFHGRGGTISRGGGKAHAAVLGTPPGAVRGRLRATEQGDLLIAKYGARSIALRTLEQATSAVALVTAMPQKSLPKEGVEWHDIMGLITDTSRETYKSLVYDCSDFFEYFRRATPVDAIERMRIGAFTSSLGDNHNRIHTIDDLRATPWIFAWTQSRHILPGWYGFGTGLSNAIDTFGGAAIRDMAESWYFFRALLADVETVLAKSDLNIAARYSVLAGELHEQFFPTVKDESDLCVKSLLLVKNQDVLLENSNTLRRAIRLRNPYIDPMSLLQVDLLKRWREGDRQDDEILSALLASVNGIARGLQDSD